MFDSGLPKSMWDFAVETAVHVYNRTPHKSNNYQTPLEKFAPNARCHLEQIKRFGCVAYVKNPKPDTKFSERAIETILVGYKPAGYLLWHPSTGKYLEWRNVKFNEKLVYKNVYKSNKDDENLEEPTSNVDTDWNSLKEIKEEKEQIKLEEKPQPKRRGRPPKKSKIIKSLDEAIPKIQKETKSLNTRSKSKRKLEGEIQELSQPKLKRIKDTSFFQHINSLEDIPNKDIKSTLEHKDELGHCLLASINNDPSDYREAMRSSKRESWIKAIREELNSMIKNRVWSLIEKTKIESSNKKPNIIDSKWVFKRKLETDGTTKFKAHLVIRGFKDENNYNLKEIYAPVSRLPVIRASLAIINKYNLHACQLDVKTAFLNGKLDDEIYMEISDGLDVDNDIKRSKVCKLENALYGLKISPKKWNLRFNEVIKKLGLENDLHEPCVYTWRKQGQMVILVIYVDDIIMASNNLEKLKEIKDHLNREFEMKDLGEPKSFLGMNIERFRDDNVMNINQSNYIESILEKFKMAESKPQSTLMVTRQANNRSKKQHLEERVRETETKKFPYREVIGSLMYLANATRPDIAFATNYLARKQLEPTEEDWICVKRVLRYLRGTRDLGLKYTAESNDLEAYTDASFRDLDNSASTGGYIIKLFGDTIAWRSHEHSYVTLSTCQAKYLAMSDAC